MRPALLMQAEHDRGAHARGLAPAAGAYGVYAANGEVALRGNGLARLPLQGVGDAFLGVLEESEVYALPQGTPLPAGSRLLSVRECAAYLPPQEMSLALAAIGLANWRASHRFCPRCGGALAPQRDGWVLVCADGHENFPRTDAAVIMAVTDAADNLLLANNLRHRENRMWSILAGFLEPGETLEAAVRRECQEEVAVAVTNLSYVGSQPWPFPASLMVGFRARSTQVRPKLSVQSDELVAACWFDRAQLSEALLAGELQLPSEGSIARMMIDTWRAGEE
ncbi:NAD(+) diphosphatase [Dermabacteraceae bacterium TAE3-ERU27]|nr:NAD(+) diphosphatase [Dermabacteraceae bacterium TAE3-ERU27]